MNRRRFIQQVSKGVALLSVSPSIVAAVKSQSRIHIGAQTNTFGAPIKTYDHLLEVLDDLVKLGYQGFETSDASLSEQANRAKECRSAFEARHIQYIAPHCSVKFSTALQASTQIEDIRRTAGYSAEMGATYLIASGGYPRNSTEVMPVEQKVQLLNQVGKACQQEGLKFCYHNHTHEFEGDHPEMNELLAKTDHKSVWFNYDVGNAYPIGPKPGDFSAEHFKRILIYHIKDVTLDSNGKNVATDLGQGKIDLKAVIAPLLHSNWQGWLTVEREVGYPNPAPNPDALLKQCRDYLREISGI